MAYSNPNVCIVLAGNGVDLTFAIPFDFLADDSVKAKLLDVTDPLAPIELAFVKDTDWSVSGTDVLVVVAPSATEAVMIYRETAQTHPTVYSTYEFPFSTANDDFDNIYQLVQENKEALDRAILNTQYDQCAGNPLVEIGDLANAPTVSAQVATNTADIATNLANIGTNDTELADHEARVSTLEASAGEYTPVIRSGAGNYVASSGDLVVVKAAAVTIDLPAVPIASNSVKIKTRGTNSVAISGNGANIDGVASFNLTSPESAIECFYDGTEWVIL